MPLVLWPDVPKRLNGYNSIDDPMGNNSKNCSTENITDLLNISFVCDRHDLHVFIFLTLYVIISLFAMVANASVVLASIIERWKEIDQFTFVFAISLSFNHFLAAFLVYPLAAYTMTQTSGWGLGAQWCNFTAYASSYFEVLYMMHVLMIAFDMILAVFTNLKDVVKVFLCKKVAMSLWVTALIPHILLWFKKSWFLEEGTLGVKHSPYETPHNHNCYVTYTYNTNKEMRTFLLCFVLIPFLYVSIQYTVLLYLRARNEFKQKAQETKEEFQDFFQRYKTSICMMSLFLITQMPKWVVSILLLQDVQDPSKLGKPTGKDMVIWLDILSFWTCLGSVLIPICYLATCPTYFFAVTEIKPLNCLRMLGTKIHGPKYKPESPSRMDDIQEESTEPKPLEAPLKEIQRVITPTPMGGDNGIIIENNNHGIELEEESHV